MKLVDITSGVVKNYKTPLVCGAFTLVMLGVLVRSHDWRPSVRQQDKPLATHLPDFAKIQPVSAKKKAFFDYLKPLVQMENEHIQYDRALLNNIESEIQDGSPYHRTPLHKLKKLAERYYYKVSNVDEALAELKLRIDVVPESLVLVQAAKESAWGTSRFAQKANNLFGHWCFSRGCGLVPNQRDAETHHEIRRFESPQASVVRYMRNLNSHSAYLELRKIRAELREQKRPITGTSLAQGLEKYSQRGEKYVNEIIQMIEQNELE